MQPMRRRARDLRLMSFNAFANKVKDAALEQVAKWFANRYQLKELGRISDLKVDSVAEEIFMVLELHGEVEPIKLTLLYRVVSPTLLEIVHVKSSRAWIGELINNVVPVEQKRVEVAPMITKALTRLAR